MTLSFVNKLFPEYADKQSVQEPIFSRKRLLAFGLTLLQLISILYIIKNFNIEKSSGISHIAFIIVLAFIVNSFVPLKFRQFILFNTCLTIILFAFGFLAGSLFLAIAFSIIGICHLKINYWYRVLLILGMGLVVFVLRIKLFYFQAGYSISPFLASMFMFRVIIYLYEIKHGMIPTSIWQSLCYFFLFPNICFLFFPIVDYKTFSKTYYNMADDELWQKGIRWMLRGLTHILAYRIVYYYFLIGHSDVTDLFSLLRYMTSSYALILRLSGLFHFIVGLLCLFGLNLPQVFNNYFLATSFTDLWRRINIYWREFMLKIFFYPIMFKLKKRVTHNLLAVTMLHVFVISWILHCYQLFWIQGSYQFNILDLAFWLILGGCITVNAVIQEKQSHIVVKERSVNIIYLFTIIKMLGMILFMSVMWSLWNSNTFTEWVYIMSNIRNCTIEDGILFFCGIVFVIGVGFITQIVLDKKIFKDLIGIKPQYTLFLTLPALLIILLCSFNVTKKVLPGSMYTFIKTIADEKLNRDDYNKVEDNYYKKLIDGEEGTVIGLWNLNFKTGKRNSTNAEIFIRTDGVFGKIYKPDLDVMINDKSFRTDSFGLRDKNYAFIKSSGTYRMALLGGSYEMGSGVDNDEVFETLVEKKLNSIYRDSTFSDFEIMNFAVGGFQAIQHIELCYTKVFQYKPDAVIYFAHSDEGMRLVNSFARLIYKKKNLKFPLLEFIKRTAVTPGMSESEISARLHPYEKVILKWAYSEISILCRKHNAIPVWVFLPTTTTTAANASVGELEVKKLATESYFVQIDLTGVYGSYDRKDIIISEWNTHPNGLGHVLIANKFYDELISNRKLIFTKNR